MFSLSFKWEDPSEFIALKHLRNEVIPYLHKSKVI